MADDGDFDDGGGDMGMDDDIDDDEFNEDDQDPDGDQNAQTDKQQLQGDDRMEIFNEDDANAAQAALRTDPSKRTTTPYMTKYERARVLGTRALQIAMCAPLMVEPDGETDPLQIAMRELKEKKIPMIIRRYLPDGSYEDWSIDELILTD
ncbi:unnamed protein product [Rotaria socialis]|uniref:RPB6 homolog n=1 Tax=Rotaria socialis TaxID=392032 RepID=A0A818E699_9BILA|nr:unnamed protein product [Rotaria socialis]CAF3242304.1 unnamed protein product [Rotaria socialis]CAF3456574.1 unnamed protein product [Rotaria socialis]CAF3456586.1 unnamed protein product [Rotaria socialis]CAF3551563.1 unnamed protein product [Rotaria socialis]